GANANRVGTDGDGVNDAAERNVISGSGATGVLLQSTGTANNVVAGNLIGTNATGTAALPNANGVIIQSGAASTRMGTDGGNDAFNANERNVISGNAANGVLVANLGTNNTVIAGNYVGTNAVGTAALGNGGNGVTVGTNNLGGPQFTRIGTNGDGV